MGDTKNIWVNLQGVKQALHTPKTRPTGIAPKHPTYPETKNGFDAALSFYKGTPLATTSPPESQPPGTSKEAFKIDVSKFIPYDSPERRSRSLDATSSLREKGLMHSGERKREEPMKEGNGAEEGKGIEINTDGVADILQELKAEKQKLVNEEPVDESIDEGKSGDSNEGNTAPTEPITDLELVESVYERLLRVRQVEAELEEMKRKRKEAEMTAEQLVIKLGKEKEISEILRLQIEKLTQLNEQLTATVEKQAKLLHQKQLQRPAVTVNHVKTTPRLW